MHKKLFFLAGPKALAVIREEGLDFERVKVMAGAAGGPKWLALYGIDYVICSEFIKKRRAPLFLIGSSIGAWKFAAYCHNNPVQAVERFRRVYISQHYSPSPSTEEINAETLRIMREFINPEGAAEILGNSLLRLNFLSTRCRKITASDNKLKLSLGITLAFLSNMASRSLLGLYFNRTLFYDPRKAPPFFNIKGLGTRRVELTEKNLVQALMASGSIPFVMQGVRNIPGAPGGVYRDGALTDYHLDLPFVEDRHDIALYPHFSKRMIPGWFDKILKWRKPKKKNLENLLLVFPSEGYVKSLPYGKIPDRSDFKSFSGADRERIAYWNKVADESMRLGEEFHEAVVTGKIRELVSPI